jgi:hypothetical protein
VFTAAPSGRAGGLGGYGPLGLQLVRQHVHDPPPSDRGGSPGSGRCDPVLERYFTDLTAVRGLGFRPGDLTAASGVTFTDLAAGMVRQLAPCQVDLVILAHAVPEFDQRLLAASYLADALPGEPMTFAIGDCGPAAPFAALRVAASYADAGLVSSALVLVLDQSTVPYELVPPAGRDAAACPRPDRDIAVALLLRAGGATTEVEQFPGVGAGQAPGILAERLRRAIAASGHVTAIVGAAVGVGSPPAGSTVIRAPAGPPCTAVWSALDGLPWAEPGQQVIIADHDPAHDCLSLCTVTA